MTDPMLISHGRRPGSRHIIAIASQPRYRHFGPLSMFVRRYSGLVGQRWFLERLKGLAWTLRWWRGVLSRLKRTRRQLIKRSSLPTRALSCSIEHVLRASVDHYHKTQWQATERRDRPGGQVFGCMWNDDRAMSMLGARAVTEVVTRLVPDESMGRHRLIAGILMFTSSKGRRCRKVVGGGIEGPTKRQCAAMKEGVE